MNYTDRYIIDRRIRVYRRMAKLSQREMGLLCGGWSQGRQARIERGGVVVSGDTMRKMLDVLTVHLAKRFPDLRFSHTSFTSCPGLVSPTALSRAVRTGVVYGDEFAARRPCSECGDIVFARGMRRGRCRRCSSARLYVVSRRVTEVREQAGMSQRDLADRTGWSQGRISQIEGGMPVSEKIVARLCAALSDAVGRRVARDDLASEASRRD